jgi:hypothetical protein
MKSYHVCVAHCLKLSNHSIVVEQLIVPEQLNKLKDTYNWAISPFQVWLVVNMNNRRQQILGRNKNDNLTHQNQAIRS